MNEHHLEDLVPGQIFRSGYVAITADAIKAFAKQFDPQPFHLDENAAKESLFGGLVASGWHTAALTMRLLVEGEYRPAGGFIGGKADEMSWPAPTKPGDVLTCETEILELRASATRPDRGSVKMRTVTRNAVGDTVYVLVMNGVVRRRPSAVIPSSS